MLIWQISWCACTICGSAQILILPAQAAREAVTSLEPAFTEAEAHLQESLGTQNDVILQVSLYVNLHG